MSIGLERSGQIDGKRGFSDAAFLVENADDFHEMKKSEIVGFHILTSVRMWGCGEFGKKKTNGVKKDFESIGEKTRDCNGGRRKAFNSVGN